MHTCPLCPQFGGVGYLSLYTTTPKFFVTNQVAKIEIIVAGMNVVCIPSYAPTAHITWAPHNCNDCSFLFELKQ